MSAASELTDEIFSRLSGAPARALADELRGWMEAAPRFLAFAGQYRDKLRKKLRVAATPETLLDARAELEVAYGLLADRRFTLAYEPFASSKRRSPDFSVTYRANLVFTIEVARIRAEPTPAGDEAGEVARRHERVLRILLDKLGQLQAGMPNLLVLHTAPELARQIDLDGLLRLVKRSAEAREPGFYALSRYNGPADFFKDFARLGGILPWCRGAAGWQNPQARPPLPPDLWRLLNSLPKGE